MVQICSLSSRSLKILPLSEWLGLCRFHFPLSSQHSKGLETIFQQWPCYIKDVQYETKPTKSLNMAFKTPLLPNNTFVTVV